MRDHGGNIDQAIGTWGGAAADWIDLSTGINRVPYPTPVLSTQAWTRLPPRSEIDGLIAAARTAYRTPAAILPVAGAQAAIQMIPRLVRPGRARILSPTYNEHAASLSHAGWQVDAVPDPEGLAGADLAVVVNPNNPDGRTQNPEWLVALADRVGMLIVDESFADPVPALSVAPFHPRGNLLVLRSFGKFYGLAGLRLGFVLGAPGPIADLAAMVGPWPVSGAAIEIGRRALVDAGWTSATTERLAEEVRRLDLIAARAGWPLVGGCALFRTYEAGDASAAQERLARARIWSRVFPWSDGWIRLGLPGAPQEWRRLDAALS
jgi:cobalamin biosynthetic protein CobC